jgi:predicted HD phosphohydrolase
LSETSKKSLKFQGGPSKGEELETFERDPLRVEMVELTSLDDRAKIMGIAWHTLRT